MAGHERGQHAGLLATVADAAVPGERDLLLVAHRDAVCHSPLCEPDGVAILIDEPRWWWRGQRWCHLVSDASLEELHTFAAAVGIPRRVFQGDHYDVPEEYRDAMVLAGAVEVESRELLRRLRAGGLRLTPAQRRARTATH
jgi:hypothetical protein